MEKINKYPEPPGEGNNMKLLIGSHNPAKIKYYSSYLKNAVEIVTLDDLNIKEDPEETEDTLEGNAI